jgi:hypothetical protein
MAKKAPTRKAKAPPKTARKATKKSPSTSAAKAGAAKAPASRRADFKQPGKVAIDAMPDPQRSIALAADKAIRAAVPGATSVVKWGNPCYYTKNDRAFAALMATRAGVNLALPGALIPDPDKLLHGTGGVMRHVKLADTKLAKSDAVRKLIVAAAKVGMDRM